MAEDATKIIVPEDMVYVDLSFQYAAAWREVRIAAGEYPIRTVSIAWHEPNDYQGPYYVVADVPCVTIDARHAGETDAQRWFTYVYNAKVGNVAAIGQAVNSKTRVTATFA